MQLNLLNYFLIYLIFFINNILLFLWCFSTYIDWRFSLTKCHCFALNVVVFNFFYSYRESRDSRNSWTYIPGIGKSRNLSNPEIFCPRMSRDGHSTAKQYRESDRHIDRQTWRKTTAFMFPNVFYYLFLTIQSVIIQSQSHYNFSVIGYDFQFECKTLLTL